jgi:predicted RNA-binding protein with PIN domain
MSLIIDGYNLLHASGILGRGIGRGSLERSRSALINFLLQSLEETQLATTTVVFDAREAPRGLARVVKHGGLTVRFADPNLDADDVIETLIKADSSPRRLTVVSSDHRLHRAARRRKATAVDSDQWYAQVLRERIERARHKSPTLKPSGPISEMEVRFWLRTFGLEAPEAAAPASPESEGSNPPNLENPFPPGYGEDIGEDDV